MDTSLDFMSSVLDEIALEGLDGITLSTLWIRIKNRPLFPLSLDENSKIFLWECIAVHRELQFYQLPQPRPQLELCDKYESTDDIFGELVESSNRVTDIYPVKMVLVENSKGSCSNYEDRKCITNQVRHDTVLLVSLKQALAKWGECLVLVASPKLRLLSLIGTELNPLMEFSKEHYCILERIGRSRYQGELAGGDSGLIKNFNFDHFHYLISKLVAKNLVKKQKLFLKKKDGRNGWSNLFHLTRYFIQRKTKFQGVMEEMSKILKSKPNHCEECKILRSQLGLSESVFKKFFQKNYQKWFKYVVIPYRSQYPNALKEDYQTKNGGERQIKVVQMVLPYFEEDDMYKIEEEEEEEGRGINPCYEPSKLFLDQSYIFQLYHLIEAAGPEGTSLRDLRRALTIPRLEIRALCRILHKKKMVCKMMFDAGRQRYEKYTASKFHYRNLSALSKSEPIKAVADATVIIKEQHPFEEMLIHPVVNEVVADIAINNAEIDKSQSSVDFSHVTQPEGLRRDPKEIQSLKGAESPSIRAALMCENLTQFPVFNSLTPRLLKRAKLIVEFLNETKVGTHFEVRKFLASEERKEGYNFLVDRRTIVRLLSNLVKNGILVSHKMTLEVKNRKHPVEFFCIPSIQTDDVEIKQAIDKHSTKFLFGRYKKKENSHSKKRTKDSTVPSKKPKVIKQKSHKKLYGVLPKFLRAKMLHSFLFYLTRNYEGEGDKQQIQTVYYNDHTWKRFVPPLPGNNQDGWCVLSDIINLLPLSVFVKIIMLHSQSDELDKYLKDPEKQNCLITHLPKEVQEHIFDSLSPSILGSKLREVAKILCCMGLASFGPKFRFNTCQDHIFVHTKASIKDTTKTSLGYLKIDDTLEYETADYVLQTLRDVENFWRDLEGICLATPLGKYSIANGQSIVIFEPSMKPELANCLMSKPFDNVMDTGKTPGDGLGAAGLDSSLFAHLPRNWFWPTLIHMSSISEAIQSSVNSSSSTIQNQLINGSAIFENSGKRLQRLVPVNKCIRRVKPADIPESSKVSPPNKESKKTGRKRGIKSRVVRSRTTRIRKPYYDEKDKVAIKHMDKLRVSWSAEEDSFLLLCRLASDFLSGKDKKLIVPYSVVRDLLQEKFPHVALDKTSRACQRRLRHILMTEETRNCVANFLSEAQLDLELVKEFDVPKFPQTHEEKWKAMFTTVLEKLTVKFTMCPVDRYKTVSLPSTIPLLTKLYNVIVPSHAKVSDCYDAEPLTVADVQKASISMLFHSSLEIQCDEQQNWGYVLYEIYQKYPDSLLTSVKNDFRKRQLITRTKHQGQIIPFRFCILYNNFFLTKCPSSVHSEAKEFLKKLCLSDSEVKLECDTPSGYTAAILSLVLTEGLQLRSEIPDTVVLVNTACLTETQQSNLFENAKSTLSDHDTNDLARLLNSGTFSSPAANECGPRVKRHKREKPIESKSSMISLCNSALEENVVNCSDDRPQSSSRLALHLLRQESSKQSVDGNGIPDCVILNHCRMYCSMKPDAANTCTLRLNSQDTVEGNVENAISYQPGSEKLLSVELINEIISEQCLYIPEKLLKSETMVSPQSESDGCAVLPCLSKEAQSIYYAILQSGKLGVSHLELWRQFSNQEMAFPEHLNALRKLILIVRVGSVSFRYVTTEQSRPWLITSVVTPKEPRLKNANDENGKASDMDLDNSLHTQTEMHINNSEDMCIYENNEQSKSTALCWETVLFTPRVWRKPDGSLNGPPLVKFLETALRHIISSPGISEKSICSHFSQVLFPVQTLELLEVLEKAYCIFKYYCKSTGKATLFSPVVRSVITVNPGPDDTVHYEALADSIVKLTQLCNSIIVSNDTC